MVVAIMLFAIAIIPASAATGNIVLECNKSGYEFTVYKLASLNETTGAYTPVNGLDSTISNAISAVGNNTADIVAACDAVTTAGKYGTTVGTVFSSGGENKTYSVEPGLYYVRATKTPSNSTMVKGSVIPMPVYTNGTWSYADTTVSLATKVGEKSLTMAKKLIHSNTTTEVYSNFASLGTGDEIDTVIYFSVPGSASKPVSGFNLVDAMNGQAISGNVSVYVTTGEFSGVPSADKLLGSSYYSTTTSGNTTTITFTPSFISTYTSDDALVVVSYKTKLANNPTVGGAGNTNTATVNWIDSEGNPQSMSDTTTIYTYQIDITKVDAANTSLGLPGAEFKLYESAAEALVETNEIMTLESGANGKVSINKTFAEGTYFLKETKAPNNYSKSNNIYTINVAPTYDNGTLTSPTNGKFSLTVTNISAKLPESGSTGSTIFIIAGVSLVLLGAAGLFIATRKSKKTK